MEIVGFFSISRNGTDDSDIWKHFSEKRGKERKISRYLSMVPREGMRTSWRFNNVAVDRLDIKKI